MSLDVSLVEGQYCSHCGREGGDVVFDYNITHNLGTMADAAGIYCHLWRPENLGIKKAKELITPLSQGLHLLKSNRSNFEKYNPVNGWGSYESLLSFVEQYLYACNQYPEADIRVCR